MGRWGGAGATGERGGDVGAVDGSTRGSLDDVHDEVERGGGGQVCNAPRHTGPDRRGLLEGEEHDGCRALHQRADRTCFGCGVWGLGFRV